jgi:hypothetical protein
MGLGPGFSKKILRLAMGDGQILASAGGIGQTLGDVGPTVFQQGQYRLEGKALEEERKDEETDELGDEELGVETKLLAHLGGRVLETVNDATIGGG